MRKNPLLGAAVILGVIILLMMCAFQVRFTETVVLTRFSKVKDVFTPDMAGLKWKWPWPIDEVHRFDARLRTFETDFRQQGTRDQRTIVLTAYANWRIADAERFLNRVGPNESAGEEKIRDRLESIVSVVLRSHDLRDLVNTDVDGMKLAVIEQEFLDGIPPRNGVPGIDGIRKAVREEYGIDINTIGIKRLGLPELVTREVFARMKEDRQKTIKELTAQGSARAEQIMADAKEKTGRILTRADTFAETIKAQGDAEAAKYYKIFEEHRELSDFLKSWQSLYRILQTGQTTIVLNAWEIEPLQLLLRRRARDGTETPVTVSGDDEDTKSAGVRAGVEASERVRTD
ncbi:MAG: SPFH domain-containing protein [Planctomycetota bacterium]|nr:SPFH domain-containing protein [Planctomycetota bacterium]